MFDDLFDGVNRGVEALFTIPNIALWLATALFVWCGVIILHNRRTRYRPLAAALDERLAATAAVVEADEPRARFARELPAIDAALAAPAPAGLDHAWRQYRATLIDRGGTIGATERPEGWFLHLGDETRVLAWWANIFVAVGLTFTFLGIVAALLKAVEAMGAGADPASMQAALIGLLHITAAKFWTSIGGVASSIALRIVDRRWHGAIGRRLQALCDRIEAGTEPVLAQRLAIEQRDLLARLSVLQPTGASAADPGPALAAAAERIAASFDRLDGKLAGLSGAIAAETSRGVERAFGDAAAAGAEQAATLDQAGTVVKGLLATLARVVGELNGVFGPLRDAARSIEQSVAVSNEALRRAARADDAVEGAASALEATSRAASEAWTGYAERFEGVDVALAGAIERIRAASVEHADGLTQQVGRIDAALAQAVDRLAGALDTIGDLTHALDDMRGELKARRS